MNVPKNLTRVEKQMRALEAQFAGLRREMARMSAPRKIGDADPATAAALVSYLALTPALAEDEILTNLLYCAMHVVRAGGASLALLDPRSKKLVFQAAVGDGAENLVGQKVPLKGSVLGLAFASGEIQSSTPVFRKTEKAAQAPVRNVLAAPLVVDGESIGTLSAVNKQDANHFTTDDMAAYQRFADLAAVIVRQRAREISLRRQISSANPFMAKDIALSLSRDEAALLALFDQLARLNRHNPGMVEATTDIVGILSRASGITPDKI